MQDKLTVKAPITTAVDDIHKYNLLGVFCLFFFLEKIRLDVSSAEERIHLKHQALFSSKDKSEKLKCHLL